MDSVKEGLVSIIMPCYNGAAFIQESIDSVRNQRYQNWELLIVDDGSTDDSIKIIKKNMADDARIKLVTQANSGSAAARNNGIKRAAGQYIALLDSDDLWFPEFLESQIKFMKENKALCVYASYDRIDENSNQVLQAVKVKPHISVDDIEKTNHIGCLTGLYDCSKYGKVYLHEDLKSLLDDYAYWIDVIRLCGEAYGNQKVLASYRIGHNSVTSKKFRLVKVHYRFYRNYLNDSIPASLNKVMLWAVSGLAKFSK